MKPCKYIIAFFSGIIFLILFYFIFSALFATGVFVNFDAVLQSLAFSFRHSFLDIFMPFMTTFGGKEIIFPVAFTVSFYLFIKKRYKFIAVLLISLVMAGTAVEIMKKIFARERPDQIYALVSGDGFGFPSGHSTLALVFYGILVYFIFVSNNKLSHKISALIIGVLLTVLVGCSRIYLGVHWPSDVLGGYILGGGLLAIFIYASKSFIAKTKETQSPLGD